MPNYVDSAIVVASRDPETLAQITAEKFSFGRFIPVPEELEGIHTGSITIDGQRFSNWRGGPDFFVEGGKDAPEVGIGQDEAFDLLAKYGALNALDWQRDNYGTKWDACDVADWQPYTRDLSDYGVTGADISASICTFSTAWSPATVAITTISKQFPEAVFILAFAEAGMDFCGVEVFCNGEASVVTEGKVSEGMPDLSDDDAADAFYDDPHYTGTVGDLIDTFGIGTGG